MTQDISTEPFYRLQHKTQQTISYPSFGQFHRLREDAHTIVIVLLTKCFKVAYNCFQGANRAQPLNLLLKVPRCFSLSLITVFLILYKHARQANKTTLINRQNKRPCAQGETGH